jgi:DNA (cytosine-5)-methyltransferase 1
MPLTVGSLFAGIGGFDLGLERAGMRIAWQSEIDPYASAVLRKHWPDVPNLGDIRNIRNPPAVDVLCGGFPCQDISFAGKGAGLAGERSGLWREYARIIGEVRPKYVLVENVAALLARGLGDVLGNLAALGFDAEWHCIPASAVGAPHRRDRLWIIGYANDQSQSRVALDDEASGMPQFAVADASSERLERLGEWRDADQANVDEAWSASGGVPVAPTFADAIIWQLPLNRDVERVGREESVPRDGRWEITSEPFVRRGDHGLPGRMDRLKALGNAIVPQIAEILGRAIIETEAA